MELFLSPTQGRNVNMRTITALMTMFALSANAQSFDYQCFGGRLSNPAVKDITDVRIGVTKNPHHASFIVFHDGKSRYSTDIFCKNPTGRCGLLDDSGTFTILEVTAHKMTIQFDGIPKLIVRERENLPMIDSTIKLKTPLRINLTIHRKSDCAY